MKRELLEHLIRTCVCEVLNQTTMNEVSDEIKGAAAPPADGQGTADQPEIPKESKLPKENKIVEEELKQTISKIVDEVLNRK